MPPTDCWTCINHQAGGMAFLGYCKWFAVHKNEPVKMIPPHIIDIGCKSWMMKPDNKATPSAKADRVAGWEKEQTQP